MASVIDWFKHNVDDIFNRIGKNTQPAQVPSQYNPLPIAQPVGQPQSGYPHMMSGLPFVTGSGSDPNIPPQMSGLQPTQMSGLQPSIGGYPNPPMSGFPQATGGNISLSDLLSQNQLYNLQAPNSMQSLSGQSISGFRAPDLNQPSFTQNYAMPGIAQTSFERSQELPLTGINYLRSLLRS